MIAVGISSPVLACTPSATGMECGWLDLSSYDLRLPIIHVIQGLVPNVLVSILVFLASLILRSLVRWGGIPQKTGVELGLMDRFFLFQIIVRAPCALLDQFVHKNTSDHLSGYHIFVWWSRLFF
jgi:hypothetical protein